MRRRSVALLGALGAAAMRPLRRELQLVFQDPGSCLDPRMTIAGSVAEPLRGQSTPIRFELADEHGHRVREKSTFFVPR